MWPKGEAPGLLALLDSDVEGRCRDLGAGTDTMLLGRLELDSLLVRDLPARFHMPD